MSVSFVNKLTTFTLPKKRAALWETIAVSIVGASYELSVAFIGDMRMRKANKTYRGKDRPTNVLAFPIAESAGEILLDIPCIRREAPRFKSEHPETRHLDYLFIHGLLHLAGYDHGDAMEREERRLMKRYFGSKARI